MVGRGRVGVVELLPVGLGAGHEKTLRAVKLAGFAWGAVGALGLLADGNGRVGRDPCNLGGVKSENG